MSYLKPDYDYDPLQIMSGLPEGEEVSPSKLFASRAKLLDAIKDFSKDITDANLHRFYGTTSLSMRTSVNVFDSVSFYKKFTDAFMHTLIKTFPEISEQKMNDIEEMFDNTEKLLAETLKSGNVENKMLLPLLLGSLEATLNYENY